MLVPKLLLFSVGILFAYCCDAQHFRVKRVDHDMVLLSPKAKIAKESIFRIKRKLTFKPGSRFRYQFFIFNALGTNYLNTSEAISKAIYRHQKSSKLPGKFRDIALMPTANSAVQCTDNKNMLVIMIDMDNLWQGDLDRRYDDLSASLAKIIYEQESKYNWAKSCTQNILGKVYDNLPMPQSKIYGRYLAMGTPSLNSPAPVSDKYFLLMDPAFLLVVDQSEIRNDNELQNRLPRRIDHFWYAHLKCQGLVQINRDANGNISQVPGADFAYIGTLPANYTNQEKRYVLQASSADIQFSSATNKDNFMMLFYSDFGANNNSATAMSTPLMGGSPQLLTFNNLNDATLGAIMNSGNPSAANPDIRSSMFGPRDLITPVINVFVNKKYSISPKLFADVNWVLQSRYLPSVKKLKFFRSYGKGFKKIKYYNLQSPILPGDMFVF